MEISLENKHIIVTGGTSGIGCCLVKKFLGLGAYVATNYHTNDERAEKVIRELEEYNEKFLCYKADVRSEKDITNMLAEVMHNWSDIDVLINNAGIICDVAVKDMSLPNWNEVIGTNLTGAFICTKLVSREMIKKKKGKIINIASLQGIWGAKNQSNYAASKAGLIAMTKSLAKELGQFNICINAVCPGHIATNLNQFDYEKTRIARTKSVVNEDFVLEDLIMFVVMFCSDKINGVSGQVFRIDSRME